MFKSFWFFKLPVNFQKTQFSGFRLSLKAEFLSETGKGIFVGKKNNKNFKQSKVGLNKEISQKNMELCPLFQNAYVPGVHTTAFRVWWAFKRVFKICPLSDRDFLEWV